jgi:aminocarboxymuconate-semialdehyde decarboxylase
MNRRHFLHTLASASGGLAFCRCDLFAITTSAWGRAPQPSAARRQVVIGGARVRTVDMHCHCYVADVLPLLQGRKEAASSTSSSLANTPMALDGRTIDARLREMDRQGIDVHAISSHQGLYHYWAEPELAAAIVKVQNDTIARVCAGHPDRFVGIGAVALQHPDLAVEQIDHAVRKLDMRGVMIGGSVNGEEISNRRFDPFWRRAEQLGALVFIHPAGFAQAGTRFGGGGWLSNTIGNPLETSVALSHMMFDGFLDRFTGLKILASHGGGYLPSYIGRSDKCHSWNADCRQMMKKPSEYLKGPQLHFDSLVYSRENLGHLVATTGAGQVVVGTDFAFDMASTTPVDDILNAPGLTPQDQIAILGGNAARLLKLPPA